MPTSVVCGPQRPGHGGSVRGPPGRLVQVAVFVCYSNVIRRRVSTGAMPGIYKEKKRAAGQAADHRNRAIKKIARLLKFLIPHGWQPVGGWLNFRSDM